MKSEQLILGKFNRGFQTYVLFSYKAALYSETSEKLKFYHTEYTSSQRFSNSEK